MIISGTTLAEVDRVCDYVPFASTVTNLIDLFEKCMLACLPQECCVESRYWTHITYKDLVRCIILLVPILGNIYIFVTDYFAYERDTAACNRAIESHASMQEFVLKQSAELATKLSGVTVTPEQMKAAPTIDQQALWAACFTKDTQKVAELLGKGISPNFYHTGQTPLVTACEQGAVEIVRLLLASHAEVSTANRCGNLPFFLACIKGHLEIVQQLRPHIADIDATDRKGCTPLMFACSEGHANVVTYLMSQGASPSKVGPGGGDALQCAIYPGDRVELLPLLLREDEDVDARSYTFRPASFNIFTSTVTNQTPLLYASMFKPKCAAYLVARSNVQRQDSELNTALHYSADNVELLRVLLAKCNTPDFLNIQNWNGSTALHNALKWKKQEAALLLIQAGVDPLIATHKGKTSLMLAAEMGFTEVVNAIQQLHKERITPEVEQAVAAALQSAEQNRAPEQDKDANAMSGLFSAAIGLIQTGFDGLKSLADIKIKEKKELIELGPIPRTGMELLFGELPWPI